MDKVTFTSKTLSRQPTTTNTSLEVHSSTILVSLRKPTNNRTILWTATTLPQERCGLNGESSEKLFCSVLCRCKDKVTTLPTTLCWCFPCKVNLPAFYALHWLVLERGSPGEFAKDCFSLPYLGACAFSSCWRKILAVRIRILSSKRTMYPFGGSQSQKLFRILTGLIPFSGVIML